MSKTINLILYKSLLYCDFFFVKEDVLRQTQIKSCTIKHFKAFNQVNLLESIKNIKLFAMLLKYVLKQNLQKTVIFQLNNDFLLSFIENFFNTKYVNATVSFVPFFKHFKNFYIYSSYFYCFLGYEGSFKNQDKDIKKVLNSNSFLISQIQANINKSLSGSYNIVFDFNDIKKIIFLMILLKKLIFYYRSKQKVKYGIKKNL